MRWEAVCSAHNVGAHPKQDFFHALVFHSIQEGIHGWPQCCFYLLRFWDLQPPTSHVWVCIADPASPRSCCFLCERTSSVVLLRPSRAPFLSLHCRHTAVHSKVCSTGLQCALQNGSRSRQCCPQTDTHRLICCMQCCHVVLTISVENHSCKFVTDDAQCTVYILARLSLVHQQASRSSRPEGR